jgi:hypothetical protein
VSISAGKQFPGLLKETFGQSHSGVGRPAPSATLKETFGQSHGGVGRPAPSATRAERAVRAERG